MKDIILKKFKLLRTVENFGTINLMRNLWNTVVTYLKFPFASNLSAVGIRRFRLRNLFELLTFPSNFSERLKVLTGLIYRVHWGLSKTKLFATARLSNIAKITYN